MLGDKVASAIVESPIYPLLIRQAKTTMKKSAEVRMNMFPHEANWVGSPFTFYRARLIG